MVLQIKWRVTSYVVSVDGPLGVDGPLQVAPVQGEQATPRSTSDHAHSRKQKTTTKRDKPKSRNVTQRTQGTAFTE